jgi:hypothetical protein
MAWTRETITDYVAEYRGAADERYLIEAIRDITTEPATAALIDLWFDTAEEES